MVDRVAPAVLERLADGVPRSKRAIAARLADRHPKDEVVRTLNAARRHRPGRGDRREVRRREIGAGVQGFTTLAAVTVLKAVARPLLDPDRKVGNCHAGMIVARKTTARPAGQSSWIPQLSKTADLFSKHFQRTGQIGLALSRSGWANMTFEEEISLPSTVGGASCLASGQPRIGRPISARVVVRGVLAKPVAGPQQELRSV